MTDFANIVIKADATQVKTASTEVQGLGKSTGALTGALKALLPVMTAVLSGRALMNMANQAREFGAAIGEVGTLLDDLDQLPRIEREAKMLASTFGGSPTQQVNAYYQAISAGAGSAEEATQLLTAANKLAVGGVTDVGTAIDGLTTLVNSYGLESGQATEVSDAMFIAMRAGKTTIEELSGSVGKAAALASTAGVSYEELLAATAALTAGGISTSESINGLKAALSNVLKPSTEAAKAAEEMGIQFDLAALQSQGLQGFMEGVTEAADGNQQQLVRLFGSVEALNTVLALTGNGAESFADIMEQMANKAGQTDIAFGKIAETMDFKLEQIQGKIAATRVVVGEFLLELAAPIVDNLANNFDSYVEFGANIVDATIQFATAINKAFAPVWEAFRAGITTLSGWFDDFYKFGAKTFYDLGVSGLKASEVIGIAFNEVFNTIGRSVEIATIETASFVDRSIAKMRGIVDSSYDTETRLAAIDKARRDSIDATLIKLRANTQAYQDQLIQVRLNEQGFTLLDGTIAQTDSDTASLTDNLRALAGSMGQATQSNEDTVIAISETGEAAETTTEALGEMNNTLNEGTTAAELQKNMLEGLQSSWADLIYDFLDEGKFRFKDFFKTIVDGFKRMVAELAAQDLMNAIFGGKGLGALTNGGLAGMISNGIGGLLSSGGGTGGGLLGGIGSAVSGLFGGGGAAASAMPAAGAGAGAWGSFYGVGAGAGAGAGGGLLSGIGSAISGGISSLGSAISSGFSSITSGIGSAVSAIPGWGWALGGAALLANQLDSGGTPTTNNGMLTQQLGNDGEFSIPPFASGAQFTGFTRRGSQQDALAIIGSFAEVDAILAAAYEKISGSKVRLNASDFIGYDENGVGVGAYFGTAFEDGHNGTPLQSQLGQYASRWITLAGAQGGASQDAINAIIGNGDVAGIIQRATEAAGIDGSHSRGLDRVPRNGYIAELHEGERVQTKQEVMASQMQSNEGGLIYQAILAILNHVIKMFDIVDRWNNNGIPEERTSP